MIAICIRARVQGFDVPHVRYAAYVRGQDVPPEIAAQALEPAAEPLWGKAATLLLPFYAFLPAAWGRPDALAPDLCEQIVYAAGRAAAEWSRAVLAAAFPEIPRVRDLPMWVPCKLPDACVRIEEPAALAEKRMAARRSFGAGD